MLRGDLIAGIAATANNAGRRAPSGAAVEPRGAVGCGWGLNRTSCPLGIGVA